MCNYAHGSHDLQPPGAKMPSDVPSYQVPDVYNGYQAQQ